MKLSYGFVVSKDKATPSIHLLKPDETIFSWDKEISRSGFFADLDLNYSFQQDKISNR